MNVELLAYTPNPEVLIAKAASTCYDSVPKDLDRARKMIQAIIKSGHESVIEHSSASFEVSGVSRVLTHELVRHRLFSFSQRSQRYVDEANPSYIIPEEIENNPKAKEVFIEAMDNAWNSYNKLQALGFKNEMSRYVLPNACTTKICISGNFREWRNFLKLRLSKRAQHEIRDLASVILNKLIEIAPSCFEDLKDESNIQNT
jgi:thymidylate synthase (FAD)